MFMVLMFTLLPLYYSDNYYNILNDKRDIYWLFSRILFVVIAVSLCISLMLVIKNHQFSKNMRTQLRKISALDVVMLLFGILAIVSTVYSADIGNSISGENAWDVGTQMIVCSVIVYFIISRCYSGKGDHPCRQSFYSFILKLFNTITVVSFSPNALQMNESDAVIFPIILSAVIQISQHELHASLPYTCIF